MRSDPAPVICRPPTVARPRLAVPALAVGTFTFGTAQALPIGLLPQIGHDLGRSLAGTGLLVTVYAVVVLLMSVPLTVLTRRVPKRSLLAWLLAVFAVSALASAVAPTFELLMAARVVTAFTQSIFWSVVTPTAAGQVAPHLRARAVAVLFTGSSLAPVVGLPAVTWLGQQQGWRAAFVALALLGGVTCAVVAAGLPSTRPEDEPAGRAEEPDRRRFAVLLGVILLGVAGQFTVYTYLTGHLVDVAGLPEASLSPVLLVLGVAGVLGAVAHGTLLARRPRAGLVLPLVLMAAAAVLLAAAGRGLGAALVALALITLGGSMFAVGLAGRTLVVAPGDTAVASAGSSAVYNGGVGAGAWIGGLVVAGAGVHATALPAALITVAALALLLCEPLLASREP